MKQVVMALILLAGSAPSASEPASLRYSYYLYVKGSVAGCEDCYVPLLLTSLPLERLSPNASIRNGLLVITYERDSIWEVKDDPVVIESGDVQTPGRFVKMNGKEYRFQRVDAAEVLKLLAAPNGTLPVHRLRSPIQPHQEETIRRVLRDFRAAQP